jgi:hypothetical protein
MRPETGKNITEWGQNITEAQSRSAETRMDIGSPTRARTWDLRINSTQLMAFV